MNASLGDGQVSSEDIVFSALYSIIVFFGVLGNTVVIIIVAKTPSMHTTANYLLTNLALADFLTLLFCPGMYDFAINSFRINSTLGDIVRGVARGGPGVPVTPPW